MLPVLFEEIAFRNVRPAPRRHCTRLAQATPNLLAGFSRRIDVRLVAVYSWIAAFSVRHNRQRERIQ